MFEIDNFSVRLEDKVIIKKSSMRINDGELHVIMGPNGAGKSTFAKALLSHPGFKISGRIKLDGKDITTLSPDEKAGKGVFLAFQNPEEIEGVRVSNFIRKIKTATSNEKKQDLDEMLEQRKELEKNAKLVGMNKEFIKRDLNVGFSGGEKKRMEMIQALSLNPKVMIFDEIDSGLDVDGVRIIAKTIEKMKDKKRCFLLITHYPRMLNYLKADYVHIMVDGKIIKSGDAKLAHEVEKKGYSQWVKS